MIPRPEYPRPLRVRRRWLNLNGTWELAYDPEDRGEREGWERGGASFDRRVLVPFPLESALSGVADPEPPPVVWYRREVERPADWTDPRCALHVGACDFETRLFVNGRVVGEHRGGYDPISCPVGHVLRPGRNEIVLRVCDPPTWTRPRGKQTAGAFRTPVDYDPVTGIWQTVWLEPLPALSLADLWTRYARGAGELAVHVALSEPAVCEVEVELLDAGAVVARARGNSFGRLEARVPVAVPAPRLWSPASPHLYDLRVRLLDGERVLDEVTSYAGLREIDCDGERLLLNGEPLYLRGVLDQGYFPEGWYAAPRDEALRRDVELTQELGFNAVRKHQKAEDPRYLYWADRLGLLVWAEMPSGRDFTGELAEALTREWTALVRRDRSHPSVITWVPFNESWGVWNQAQRPEERALVEGLVALTRSLDPTRPVVGNDGWEFAAGDLWTLHLYEGEVEDVPCRLAQVLRDPSADVVPSASPIGPRVGALSGADPRGLPVLLTECGGIGYVAPGEIPPRDLFAYGELPSDEAELEARIARIAGVVADCRGLSGYVWTQLTDVQQEVNGLLYFDRRPKLPLERLRAILGSIGVP